MFGRKALFLSSFLVWASRLTSSRSILIIYFWMKSMNLECSEFFFFSSGLRGLSLSSSWVSSFCSSSHCFSERMWLLFLFSNLNWLNSSMHCWTMGSCSLIFRSSLLLMLTLSTDFSTNFTISTAYLPDRLSCIWIECRLIVSSKITYFISPFALQVRFPSSSQWKKKNQNLTPSFFMNSMQSPQFMFSLLAILPIELQARMLTPYFTIMNPSRMKISLSSFSRISVIAFIVMRVSVRVLFTIRFLMFFAASLAWISTSSFRASKNIFELTFYEYFFPFLKVQTERISLPIMIPWLLLRLVSMQSPLRLVRSERSTSACRVWSRSLLSRQLCLLKISMKRRWEVPSQMQEKASLKTSWFSLMNSPAPWEVKQSLPILMRYLRPSLSICSSSSRSASLGRMLPMALISWMISQRDIGNKLINDYHLIGPLSSHSIVIQSPPSPKIIDIAGIKEAISIIVI